MTDLSDGATVHLVTGDVDYAGLADPAPATTSQQIGLDRQQGRAPLVVPTRSSRHVRVQVRNADGDVIGFSNPVWILKEQPRHGIPTERRGSYGWAG